MTITACPIEGATIEQQVAERIEILAALIQLNSDDSVYSANPRLINVLHITPLLREHRAGQILRTIMPSLSRDGLIKQIVSISYGNAVSEDIEDLTAAIDDISALWDQELGGIAPILAEAYQTMVRRVALLYDGIDPVNDLTRMTGEEDKLRIVINPSLFLPPPQTGRHGASIVSRQHGDVSHLFFGYPLDENLKLLASLATG